MTRQIRQGLVMVVLAAAFAAGFFTRAEAAVILITPTADARGIDSFLDGNYSCCVDPGIVTATRNMSFEERVALEFALVGLPAVNIAIDPAFIRALLTADEDFAGFIVRNVTVPSGVLSMYTSDSGFPDFFPTLAIEYDAVAEPGSLLLLGTGLALVARHARRRLVDRA